MKILKAIAFGLASLIIVKVGAYLYVSHAIPASSAAQAAEKSSRETLRVMVDAMGKNYPKVLPSGVRIDKLTLEGEWLTYHKTVLNMTIDEFDKDVLAANRDQVRQEACGSAVKNLLSDDVSLRYIYRDMNGAFLIEYRITLADCT